MTNEHDQVIKDEAEAEKRLRRGVDEDIKKRLHDEDEVIKKRVHDDDEADKGKKVKGKAEKEVPKLPVRVPGIDLSPLAEDAPVPVGTVAVQSSLLDPESKKVFELLIVEIRKQLAGGGGEAGTGGVSQAAFDALKASVVSDLNSLRDAIMLTNASLDADSGVATDTFAENGDPPPLTTVA